MPPKSARTAFVFAGGGSLGAIQAGALREIVRAGERADLVVGASVGALNACHYAVRPDLEGAEALCAVWRGLKRDDVFPLTLRGALGWLRGAGSLFEQTALRNLVGRHLPLRNLEDAALPVHVVATNLSGAAVCLSRGAAVDAVLASAAIPIAFPSVQIGDQHLMDGAIAGNTPILTAAELGATRIVVLQTGYACSIDGPPMGAVARGVHALTLLIANQMERDLKLLDGKVEVHVAPHLCPLDVSPFNFDHSSALIERAAEHTRQWLDSGGLEHPATSGVFDHDHTNMMGAMPAFGGRDLVSYFSGAGKEQIGSQTFAYDFGGQTYFFANTENRELFASSPESFLPQYEGLCAYAMARGSRVKGDPENFQIINERLYFNLNEAVSAKWRQNSSDEICRADKNWRASAAP